MALAMVALTPRPASAQRGQAGDTEAPYERGSPPPDPLEARNHDAARRQAYEAEGRRVAIWSSPVLTALAAVGPRLSTSGGSSPSGININVGTTISLRRGVDLMIHVGVTLTPRYDSFARRFGFTIAPQFLLTGDRRLNGFFVAPKFELLIGDTDSYSFAFALGPGLDACYEWTVGGFHFALVTGFTAALSLASPFYIGPPFSPLVNFTGFRLGGAL